MMNLIFLNSLEKKVGDDRVRNAQISISEEKGIWNVFWTEVVDDGKTVRDCVFEGYSWEEMLDSFRRHVHEKINEGFAPMVKDVLAGYSGSNRMQFQSLLQYYSDSHMNEDLYESLRQWRRDRATKDGKSLFIVATNVMLRIIATFIPQNREELQQIPGMSNRRLELYADEILHITTNVERATSFPLDWVSAQIDMADYIRWYEKEMQQKEQAQLVKQENRKKLLQSMQDGESITSLQKKLAIHRRELLFLIEELDKEGYDVIPWVEKELSEIQEEHLSQAWKAFQEQGDRLLKPVLAQVYPENNMTNKDLNRAYEWLRLLRLKFRKEKDLVVAT